MTQPDTGRISHFTTPRVPDAASSAHAGPSLEGKLAAVTWGFTVLRQMEDRTDTLDDDCASEQFWRTFGMDPQCRPKFLHCCLKGDCLLSEECTHEQRHWVAMRWLAPRGLVAAGDERQLMEAAHGTREGGRLSQDTTSEAPVERVSR